ncbi:DsbA family protein [Longimicrobium sp.]|uniref:DsbA family protein n=1 Tax=Longimicrobium sp. TaxID=2029185 RepID=UPI002C56B4E1|nr:DsbA family protein [Longimicrobium sp.]HSU13522.1 DsbA family protein [Longimicrobium sp.]
MKKEAVLNAAVVVMMVCAVTVTALVVRREIFPPAAAATPANPVRVGDWRSFAEGGQKTGNPAAPVTVVEFADFQCPACRKFADQVHQAELRHPGKILVVYRHYPLQAIHPYAMAAANAAECAAEQGRFAEFHDVLFASQDSIGRTPWVQFARAAAVPDTARFTQCVDQRRYQARIQADISAGRQLKVDGTPTVVVNGLQFTGVGSDEDFESLIVKLLD